MSPGFGQTLLAFMKGTDPPLKADNETTDDFQTRVIQWLVEDRRTLRALLWAVVALEINSNWVHLGG